MAPQTPRYFSYKTILTAKTLDDWALHIRRNYIEDTGLQEDVDDNEMTVEQYLHDYVIPQKEETLGATVRSADI